MASRFPFVHTSGLLITAPLLVFATSLVQAGTPNCGVAYCSAPILTGATTTGSGHRDTTQAFAGINWNFGGGPELVVGVRALRTDSSHKVAGARLEATFPFTANQIGFDKLRLRLVGGHRSGMYELGGGYAFAGKGFILSSVLQSDHVNVGTDLTLNGYKWQPFVGVNSLSRAKAPTQRQDGTPICASEAQSLELVSNAPEGVTVPEDAQRNGYTCVESAEEPV